eukprot:CAMPEP_0195136286 /NCGR_PEP_ID=MMETSP0448-20130528/153947_1 /TAXON_ID=66468 /ORGANISM="Heterocapsa triquestra, Strain CCMP 448" /LENGTH=241 /DNA_ID=CAMNT_0040174461 /DNA_START=164 /DNA_END=888 /DNA_ORIENTATION=-
MAPRPQPNVWTSESATQMYLIATNAASPQEWVPRLLVADRGLWAVTRDDAGVRVERQELVLDAADDLLRIRRALERGNACPGCPSNGATEERIAWTAQLVLLEEIRHGAGRVPRAVDAPHGEVRGPLDDVAVCQEGVRGRKRLRWQGHTEVTALLRSLVVQAQVILVHQDLRPRPLLQLGGAQDVIQVAVGHQDTRAVEALCLKLLHDDIHIAAGIHHTSLLRLGVADDAAVALQRRHRED